MSDAIGTQPAAGVEASTHVARLLPATAPTPEPARRTGFLRALLLHWIVPRRYGPHLAVGSWWRAVAAHLIALAVTAGAMAPLIPKPFMPMEEVDLSFRERLAALILEAAQESAGPGFDWVPVVLTLLSLPLFELGLVLVAILVMPWYPGGDRAGSVFKRSLKSVYWSTTILIPLAPLVLLISTDGPDTGKWLERHSDYLTAGVLIAAFGLPAVQWARLLLVGGTRYVGPPDGPAFAPREPLCEQCGYLLVGLPVEARCPECGESVQASLPGGRRHPTQWQLHELRPRGFLELLRLQWRVLKGGSLWDTLPVHEGLSSARHFWWGTWCLMVLLPLAALQTISLAGEETRYGMRIQSLELIPAALAALIAPLLLQSLIMFAACLWGQLRYGIRDYRNAAVVCYYAAPLMWPAHLFMMAVFLTADSDVALWLEGWDLLNSFRPWLSVQAFAALIIAIIWLAAVAFWWHRLADALRRIRFANV